jgi:APA family basic amino acid/polyamine antiporter
MSEGTELRRSLGWWDAVSIVVGIVIGAGIFVTPQDLAKAMPSAEGMIGAWVVSGLLVFCGALAFAELSSMFPQTGGLYVYLREAFGPEIAFSSGWIHLCALLSGATAYIAMGFGKYLSSVVTLDEAGQRGAALALIVGLSGLNAWSTRAAFWLQNAANVAKLVALLALALGAFAGPAVAEAPAAGSGSFAAALAICFFCYEGWSYAGFVAGEMKDPARNLPKVFAVSFAIVVGVYLLMNLAYMRVMTVSELQSTAQLGTEVARRALGPFGAGVVTATILIAIVGSVNGILVAASRMYFAQAKDGLFLPTLERLHPARGTPLRAIAVHCLVSCAMIFAPSIGNVLQAAIFSAWLYYFATVAGLMWLRRRRPELARPYRTWGYPVTPVLFLLGSGQFLVGLFLQNAGPPVAVLALLVLSFPIAKALRKSNSERSARSAARLA